MKSKQSSLLKNLIKERLRVVLNEGKIKFVSKNAPVLIRIDRYLQAIPALKDAVVLLLSSKYRFFVVNIDLMAPKPTIFRIHLRNNYYFDLKYIGDGTFQAKISGKRFNLAVSGEITRACNAISELLTLNKKTLKEDMSGGAPAESAGGDMGGSIDAGFDVGSSGIDGDTGPDAIPRDNPDEIPEDDPLADAGIEPELN